MSIDKADVKIGAAHEIGCRLDDVLDGTTKDMYRLEGAATALQQAIRSVENVMKVADKELDNDRFDLETVKFIKTYLQRTHTSMTNLAAQAETNKLTQSGKVQAMQKAVEITKKFKDEELTKAQNLRAAYVRMKEQLEARDKNSSETTGDVTDEKVPRPIGMRPGLSIKERRKLEAAAAQTAEQPTESDTPPSEPENKVSEDTEATQENSENIDVSETPDSSDESKLKVKRQKK